MSQHAPFLECEIESVRALRVATGPGVLQGIMIGNAGCCIIELSIDGRTIFRMQPAFAGSFYLGIGFNEWLEVSVAGEQAAHLYLSYRLVTPTARAA